MVVVCTQEKRILISQGRPSTNFVGKVKVPLNDIRVNRGSSEDINRHLYLLVGSNEVK